MLAALDASDRVYILSARHGLLDPQTLIEPYDVTLKTMPRAARLEWGQTTGAQLSGVVKRRDVVSLFCGEEYIEPLRPALDRLGVMVDAPLATLSLGQRLQRLAVMNDEVELQQQMARFSRALHRLWLGQAGGRRIAETHGKQLWPAKGLYFILEPTYGLNGGRMPRVVRVGTHAVSAGSKTSLWNRLSTHRGTSSGGGSHRSSIFRLHVGRAVMCEESDTAWPRSWAEGQTAPADIRANETGLEQRVSQIIGQFAVLWLDVDDASGPESERAYLERNTIGLLSRAGLLTPASRLAWLGRLSPDWRIAVSGLWNLNHVFRRIDNDFLDRLDAAIDRTIGQDAHKAGQKTKRASAKVQLSLFKEGRRG